MTQYTQIADAKANLRYQNGRDTLRYLDGVSLPGVRRLRPAVEVALGASWSFGGNLPKFNLFGMPFGGPIGMEFTAEGYAWIPTTTIFTDGTWRQASVGLRMTVGYQWIGGR
jgi:hypothetical protein